MFRGRRAHARPRLAGARRRLHPRQPPRPRARRAERRSGAHRGAGGRSPHGCGRLLPQSGSRARAGLEPEAARGLRGARAARARLPVPHGGRRHRHAGGRRLARQSLAARVRRPDARAGGSRRARDGRRVLGDPTGRRSGDRRRVVVRHRPGRPGLEAPLLHPGVAAAVGARRRPRTLPRAHIRQIPHSPLRPSSGRHWRAPASRWPSARGRASSRRPGCRWRGTSPSLSPTSFASWGARATTTPPRCS